MGTIEFRCSLSQATTPLPHFWEHTVGSSHALLALRADWQTQLRRCHDDLGFRYVRFHGLLSDHIGPRAAVIAMAMVGLVLTAALVVALRRR